MSTIFQRYIERRKEVRALLDLFSAGVFKVMAQLCAQFDFTDPVNAQKIMRVERDIHADGSITVALLTSNERSLTFLFQANGEARTVSALSGSPMAEEYVDFTQKGNGEILLSTETEELLLQEYVYGWAASAFEE